MKNKKLTARIIIFMVACLMLIGAAVPSFALYDRVSARETDGKVYLSNLRIADTIGSDQVLYNDGADVKIYFGYKGQRNSEILYQGNLSDNQDMNHGLNPEYAMYLAANDTVKADSNFGSITGYGVWTVREFKNGYLILVTQRPSEIYNNPYISEVTGPKRLITLLNVGDKIVAGENLSNDSLGGYRIYFGYVSEGAQAIKEKGVDRNSYIYNYQRMMLLENYQVYTCGTDYGEVNGDGVWTVLEKTNEVLVLGTSKPNSGGIVSSSW